MTEKPATITEFATAVPVSASSRCGRDWESAFATVRDYVALTKPEVNALVLLTTVGGFCAASLTGDGPFSLAALVGAVAGTLLLASGTGVLNQVIEREFDGRMRRTMRRPVAAGRVTPGRATWLGAGLALAGALWLFAGVNATAASLGIFGLLIYLLLYTPLKRKTSLCTLVGATAGAVPPLIGWFAGGGTWNATALLLYSLLFLWQFPHFMSIAWIYRADYERAGYRVFPPDDHRDRFAAMWTILPCIALLALIVLPACVQGETLLLPAGIALGCGLLLYGIRFTVRRTNSAARQLLNATILYVPLALAFLIVVEVYRPPIH